MVSAMYATSDTWSIKHKKIDLELELNSQPLLADVSSLSAFSSDDVVLVICSRCVSLRTGVPASSQLEQTELPNSN